MVGHLLQYASRMKRLYRQQFQPLSAELELSQLEIDILLFLYNNPAYNTARDITAMRGFAKSNVSTAVESLRHRGWLTVEPDPESRRIQRLRLAKARAAQLRMLADCQEQCFAVMLAGFTAGEIDAQRLFWQRVDANVKAALAANPKG